ncbi:alpha-glucuronidase [Leuconostoc falkenbergense]|uniref:alpha-glucuronidase n=1 Tax=Leuconostoc falkenbergense TaxID=2766470 RepID=UPI0039E8B4A9
MSFDKLWFNQENLSKITNDDKFYFDSSVDNDGIGIQLRIEIVEILHRIIVNDRQDASIVLTVTTDSTLGEEGYSINEENGQVIISGQNTKSLMYAFYDMLRRKSTNQSLVDVKSIPSQAIRMINHWDQIDGTVERGYSGESIFFGTAGKNENVDNGSFDLRTIEGNPFRNDFNRIEWYARFLASIGINAVSLNNVNVRGLATKLIIHPFLDNVADIAKIFHKFGIKTFLAINFGAPKRLSGLTTSDPLDDSVRLWWQNTVKEIYKTIPDFGGFVVKADSEGEPGPYQYGRNHAEGANMLGEALAPFGGIVIWRAFVYNSKQDWRDRTTDRAKAASENFEPLDGQFAENVVLQVKFGPIDFQTREPLTPLFGAMKQTNLMLEAQITAEYLGHQIDINYSAPQWQSMLDFDTKSKNVASLVKEIIPGDSLKAENSGMVAVGNVRMDDNWTGNKLAQANFYAWGRLAWHNDLSAFDILKEWITQTFANVDSKGQDIIYNIMSTSNETYEKYNAPLGVGFMVRPHYHYGVSINGYEYDRWGTYHFADRNGVGVDRTQKTGTGYTGLYAPQVAEMYEKLDNIPDELLLFFHHVPYTHVLHSGKTVIQHIYDTHFEGYATVLDYIQSWSELKGNVDNITFKNVSERLELQKQNALEWRDQINTYFYRMSGIEDEKGRVIYA